MAGVGLIHAHGPICHPATAVSFSESPARMDLGHAKHTVRVHQGAHLPSLLPVPSTSSPFLSTYVTAPCRVRLHACKQGEWASWRRSS